MSAVERPTDGPDTELAAATAWLGADPARVDALAADKSLNGRHAATIVRAVLARLAAGRGLVEYRAMMDFGPRWMTVTKDEAAAELRRGRLVLSRSVSPWRTAQPDDVRPADEPRRCPMDDEPLMAMDAHRDGVTFYRHADGHGHLDARAELSAAPADDTAAPDGLVTLPIDELVWVKEWQTRPVASWRCLLAESTQDEGYASGACRFDHQHDTREAAYADALDHLERWHHLAGQPVRDTAAPDAPSVWDSSTAPGGYVCRTCGTPVESEPCAEHQPAATARIEDGRVPYADLSPTSWEGVRQWPEVEFSDPTPTSGEEPTDA